MTPKADFYSMNVRPCPSEDDKLRSIMVLVYDENLEDYDFGYFNFATNEWHVVGYFSMNLKCWCEVPMPKNSDVFNYNTQNHFGYRK